MQALRMAAVWASVILPPAVTAQQALASSRQTVIVLPVPSVPDGGRDWNSDLLAAFRNQPALRVVDPARVATALERQHVPSRARIDDGVAVRLGKQLSARYVVISDLTVVNEMADLELHTVDVMSGGRVGLPIRESGPARELMASLDDVAGALSRRLEPAVPLMERRIPVEASMAYARGLDYEKRGRTDVAVRLFERALQLYPRHDQARSALDRIQQGGKR